MAMYNHIIHIPGGPHSRGFPHGRSHVGIGCVHNVRVLSSSSVNGRFPQGHLLTDKATHGSH
jgi:hypothetical protein